MTCCHNPGWSLHSPAAPLLRVSGEVARRFCLPRALSKMTVRLGQSPLKFSSPQALIMDTNKAMPLS